MLKNFSTREVKIGKVKVGSNNPIRIQSMTNTKTSDVSKTVNQIMELSDAGCEIARVTVQGHTEAQACENIKNNLLKKGYDIPLVADIHFYPKAAMMVADFVDKIRINPGNYLDRRAVFKTVEYSDEEYLKELNRIEEGFLPLIEKCKKRKIPIRIGVNHGSLSDRIMSRFGNTVEGMVESAIEYTKFARKYDFHDIFFSMKASYPVVMIQAYRQLVSKMIELGWDYPLHLGVTEAGSGEDGRIKSAIGIGSLLKESIGDTIRVSLTENPVNEIEAARQIIKSSQNKIFEPLLNNFKREITKPKILDQKVSVVSLNKNSKADFSIKELEKQSKTIIVDEKSKIDHLNDFEIIIFKPSNNFIDNTRSFVKRLFKKKIQKPVFLHFKYDDNFIPAAIDYGSVFLDKLAEGMLLESNFDSVDLSFNILQACRIRQTKTEYISCPGCGRTLFDLEKTAKTIQEKTKHLPGLKIAVMGCIVNGPGEMADADFGYVGSGINKVDLYADQKMVEKNIDSKVADIRLIKLIKKHGKWKEPIK